MQTAKEIENLKKEIAKVFKIKDLGKIKECLEMRISRDRKKEIITLDQENYTKDVLRFEMVKCKTCWHSADSKREVR